MYNTLSTIVGIKANVDIYRIDSHRGVSHLLRHLCEEPPRRLFQGSGEHQDGLR